MHTTENDWLKFGKKILQVGNNFKASLRIPDNVENAGDPKFVACLLGLRTLSHLRAVLKLIREDMVVEARVVARCCFENQYSVVTLALEGKPFVNEMKESERQGRKARGELLIKHGRPNDPKLQEELRDYLRGLRLEKKRSWLTPKDLAERAALEKAYIFYAILSGDAGHPSLEALDRHINKTTEGEVDIVHGFHVEPKIRRGEKAETVQLASLATLGVLVAVNWILYGKGDSDPELSRLYEEHTKLSANTDYSLDIPTSSIVSSTDAEHNEERQL